MALRCLRRALPFRSAPLRFLQHSSVLPGSDFSGHSTYVPQSASAIQSAQQGFMRDLRSAYSAQAFKHVEASNVQDYNQLISALNQKRRQILAREVYEDMLLDGIKPSDETFFLLIDGCMKSSRLQDVMYFFEEMKAMGLTPDVSIYNCVIAACGRSMLVDLAFRIAEEMEASGILPRHRTFLALLRTCALAGRVDEAYGVVRRMAASGLSLDNNFYSALIIAHKNKKPRIEGIVEKIFELLEQSKQQCSEDLLAVAATGEFETSEDIDDGLASLLTDDIQPRRGFVNRRLAVYHAAVKSLTTLGNTEAVRTVLKLIETDGHELDSYCVMQLIKCHLAIGDFDQACSEYSKYIETGRQPTLELYMVLIEGALENCTPESYAVAQRLLADLVQRGYFLNAQLGSQLLQRACQPRHAKDMSVAHMVWDIMKNREVKISKIIVQDYYRALERSNMAKDDPRLIAIKAMLDEGRRVNFKGRTDAMPTAPSDDVPSKQMPSLEQESGQTVSLDIPSNQFDSGDANSMPALDPESLMETSNSSETLVETLSSSETLVETATSLETLVETPTSSETLLETPSSSETLVETASSSETVVETESRSETPMDTTSSSETVNLSLEKS